MPLFETLPINESEVRDVVKDHWGLTLKDCLKTSQNHTFLAVDENEKKFIVRVTPDPHGLRQESIEIEIALLDYLHSHKLPVSKSIPTTKEPFQKFVLTLSKLTSIVVFEHALGEPVNLFEWKFMTEKDHVVGVGKWFSQLHTLTKKFAVEHRDLYTRTRLWNELHERVLDGVPLDEVDVKNSSDPEYFGLIHGDVNVSNYFWNPHTGLPHMFDWDQAQRAWFLYDLSSPIWTVVAMKQGGSPLDQSPVPQANVERFIEWLLEGYEYEGKFKVDRAALQRMVGLRRQLYKRFCSKAVLELPPDHPMAKFCVSVNVWIDKPLE